MKYNNLKSQNKLIQFQKKIDQNIVAKQIQKKCWTLIVIDAKSLSNIVRNGFVDPSSIQQPTQSVCDSLEDWGKSIAVRIIRIVKHYQPI